MILQKWNYETRVYELFDSPAKIVVLYTEDMDMPVDCTNCGTRVIFGDTFTSKTIHNNAGLGFPVCEVCYAEELTQEGKQYGGERT